MFSQYAKGLAAVITAALTAVQTAFPSAWWLPVVTAASGAVLVVLIPNTAPAAPSSPLTGPEPPVAHTGTPPAATPPLGPLGDPGGR